MVRSRFIVSRCCCSSDNSICRNLFPASFSQDWSSFSQGENVDQFFVDSSVPTGHTVEVTPNGNSVTRLGQIITKRISLDPSVNSVFSLSVRVARIDNPRNRRFPSDSSIGLQGRLGSGFSITLRLPHISDFSENTFILPVELLFRGTTPLMDTVTNVRWAVGDLFRLQFNASSYIRIAQAGQVGFEVTGTYSAFKNGAIVFESGVVSGRPSSPCDTNFSVNQDDSLFTDWDYLAEGPPATDLS